MKKLIALSAALLLLFSLASCKKLIDVNLGNGAEFKYDSEYVKQNLTGDYSITYKTVSYENGQASAPTYTTATRTSQGYYYETTDEDGYKQGILYILSGDKYLQCYGSPEEGFELPEETEYTYAYTKEEVETLGGWGVFGFMTYYSDWATMMSADGTETIAGRKCDKFKAGFSILGTGIQNIYAVDQQTGVCMKYALAASAQGEYGAFEFECTEFKTGGCSLPAYS